MHFRILDRHHSTSRGEFSSSDSDSGDDSVVTEGNESEGPSPSKQPRPSSKRTSPTFTPTEVDAFGNPVILRRSLRKVLEESKNFTPLSTPGHSRDATPTRTSLRKFAPDVTVSRSSTPSISSKESISTTTLTRESRDSSPAPSGTETLSTHSKAAIRGGRRRKGRRGRRKIKIPSVEGAVSDCEDPRLGLGSDEESNMSRPFESYKDNDTDSITEKSTTYSACSLFKDKRITNTPSPDIDKMDSRVSSVSDKALSDSELPNDEASRPASSAAQSVSTDSSIAHRDALLNGPTEFSEHHTECDPNPDEGVKLTCDEQSIDGCEKLDDNSEISAVKDVPENGISDDYSSSSVSTLNEVPISNIKSEPVDEKAEGKLNETPKSESIPPFDEDSVKEEKVAFPLDNTCVNGLMNGTRESPVECKPLIGQDMTDLVTSQDSSKF